jgi:hypothetical protein
MATRKPTPPDAGADAFAAAAGGPPAPNPYAAASARHQPAPPKRSRGWRAIKGLLLLLLVAALLLAAGAWVWSGRNTSLATTLAQVARWLPASQQLATRDVSGSLRGGGQIGWLRWSSSTMVVEVDNARIGWTLAPLLQRSVQLGEVHADRVRISTTPDPDAPPTEPLQSLELPVSIDVPFSVDVIEWVGPPPVEARGLAGRYQYDRVQHRFNVDGVDLAQGHYQLAATLQAQAPMAVQATLDGQVRTVTPGSAQLLELAAHATVSGTLATEAARLQVLAQLRPPALEAANTAASAMQADLRADIAPKAADWDKAVAYWNTLATDADAVFDSVVELKGAEIAPQVTWGTSPEQVLPINGRVPDPAQEQDATKRTSIENALKYMGLTANTPIEDIKLDKIFIGSCTNSRIEDLRAAAVVAKGKKVASSIQLAMVVPGSGQVKRMAEAEGLDKIFTEAGFEWREPGCSMCLAMNADRLSPGERCASTSNRNFEGRQGQGGRTHLVSPAMAVAAAIAGHFVDVRSV